LFHGLRLEHHGQNLGGIAISLRVAAYTQHGEDPEALLGAGDKALYQAKHAGRDRVVAVERSMEPGSA
jgi:PleD family two-component response regulator